MTPAHLRRWCVKAPRAVCDCVCVSTLLGVRLLVPAGGEKSHTLALMLLAPGTYQITAATCRLHDMEGPPVPTSPGPLARRPRTTTQADEEAPLLQPLHIIVTA